MRTAVVRPLAGSGSVDPHETTVHPLGQGSREAAFQDHGVSLNFGDTEMGGNNPKITIEATVREERVGQQAWLVLDGDVEMVAQKGDRSSFYRSFGGRVARIPAGCTLRKPATGTLRASGGEDNHKWTWYTGKGIIKRAHCLSDTKGNDKGKLGCAIEFRPIELSDR